MSRLDKFEREQLEDERRVKERFIYAVADLDSEVVKTTLEWVLLRLKTLSEAPELTTVEALQDELRDAITYIEDNIYEPLDEISEALDEESDEDDDEDDDLILLTDFLPTPKEDDNY